MMTKKIIIHHLQLKMDIYHLMQVIEKNGSDENTS